MVPVTTFTTNKFFSASKRDKLTRIILCLRHFVPDQLRCLTIVMASEGLLTVIDTYAHRPMCRKRTGGSANSHIPIVISGDLISSDRRPAYRLVY